MWLTLISAYILPLCRSFTLTKQMPARRAKRAPVIELGAHSTTVTAERSSVLASFSLVIGARHRSGPEVKRST
ncbi:hypothetical protein C8R43DRAFT_1010982 [Mycena crocata]|nr:hypothetical protein C8R43DRAFT_1010982 [Mycena crocata]